MLSKQVLLNFKTVNFRYLGPLNRTGFLMKKLIFIFCILSISFTAFSQLDIVANYERPTYSDWDQAVEEQYRSGNKFFEHSYSGGFAFRYYPFPFRMGFVPELNLSYSTESRSNDFFQGDYSMLQVGLYLPVQLFPFDMYGDCNCPTFGKQNDFFQKAIYFKFIPGVAFQSQVLEDLQNSQTTDNIIFSLGAGAGLNFALSELITLAPEISYHYIFNENWDGFSIWHNLPDAMDHSSANKLLIGLRLSFYFE